MKVERKREGGKNGMGLEGVWVYKRRSSSISSAVGGIASPVFGCADDT